MVKINQISLASDPGWTGTDTKGAVGPVTIADLLGPTPRNQRLLDMFENRSVSSVHREMSVSNSHAPW